METLTSVALIATAIGFGLALVIWGIRGAVRTWREDLANKREGR